MSAKHTPGPWHATGSAANYDRPGDGDRSAMMDWSSGVDGFAPYTENEAGDYEQRDEQQVARGYGRTADEARENAAHIVRCVNAHDELVAALRGVVQARDVQTARRIAVAALRAIGEEAALAKVDA